MSRPLQFGLPWLLVALVWLSIALAMGAKFGIGAGVVGALLAIGLFWGKYARIASIVACLLLAGLLSLIQEGQEGARRSNRHGKMRKISLALHQYHYKHGHFPPAYVADEQGRPMHSWRVLLLPYLDLQQIYDQYDFSEPWNGPNNSRLAPLIPAPYQGDDEASVMANFLAVRGPETLWPGIESRKSEDIADGPENTIMFVESANSGIHWMEPRDFDLATMPQGINISAKPGISSPSRRGASVAFADGRYRFLPRSLDWATLRALLTIAGREERDAK